MTMQVSRAVDHTVYPRKALAEARQAYREYCDVTITPLSVQRAQVTISVKAAYHESAREVILEFLNYALDRSVQAHFEDE
jgi:hypothetical protein